MSGFTTIGKKEQGRGDVGTAGGSVGPFGTSLVSNMTPSGQATFVYGINNIQWTTSSSGIGAGASASESIMTCTSGGSLSGSCEVTLARGLKYRAGQGGVCRLTAIFGPGAPDTKQLAGVGNGESGFYFAMSGSDFGILHRETSKREIRAFTITAPPAGAANIVVTLAGESKTVAINGGASASQTAYQLSLGDYSGLGSGWSSEAVGSIVYFIARTPGPFGGTFSATDGGSPIATVARTRAGVLATDTFIPQSQWNIDTMDGNGPSRFTLDRTKGNIYSIGYQYLGFGNPTFSIEDTDTGFLADCHQIKSANLRTTTVVKNPTMFAKWAAINSGSLATSVSVKGASAGTFTEGLVVRNVGISFSAAASKANVSTLVPLITLRTNNVYNGESCYGALDLFNISVANDAGSSSSGKLLKFYFYKNAVLGGPVNFQLVDSSRSIAATDTAATSVTTNGNTQLIKTLIVAANSSEALKIDDENFFIGPGESVTIAVERVSNTVDTAAISISWFEDQ